MWGPAHLHQLVSSMRLVCPLRRQRHQHVLIKIILMPSLPFGSQYRYQTGDQRAGFSSTAYLLHPQVSTNMAIRGLKGPGTKQCVLNIPIKAQHMHKRAAVTASEGHRNKRDATQT